MSQKHRISHLIQKHLTRRKMIAHVVVITTLAAIVLLYTFQLPTLKTSAHKARQSSQQEYQSASTSNSAAIEGTHNYHTYGQCTWWAVERYHQLHGIYPPGWYDAWQWTSNAQADGWTVSGTPTVGDIIVLQRGVQGTSGEYGHVAIVEEILSNGNVRTSNMNWNGTTDVTYVEFAPGDGVAFIHA